MNFVWRNTIELQTLVALAVLAYAFLHWEEMPVLQRSNALFYVGLGVPPLGRRSLSGWFRHNDPTHVALQRRLAFRRSCDGGVRYVHRFPPTIFPSTVVHGNCSGAAWRIGADWSHSNDLDV